MSYKALDDYTPEEVVQVFVTDCLVQPTGNNVVPEFVLLQLLKVYCEQIGAQVPDQNTMRKVIRRTYTSTMTPDGKNCFRAALKPGLIQEG